MKEGEVRTEFGVDYSVRQVRRILKSFKMKHAKLMCSLYYLALIRENI